MTTRRIESEHWAGLAIAALAHAGLLAFLMLRPPSVPQTPPVERVSVTLADDVGLAASAPSQAEPAPAMAPSEGDAAPPPAPSAEAPPEPAPQPASLPKIQPQPQPKAQPQPQPRPVPLPRQAVPVKPSVAPPLPRQVPQQAKPQPRPAQRPAQLSAATAPPLPRQVATRPVASAQPLPRQVAASGSRTASGTRPGAKSFSDAFANIGNPARASGTAPTPKAALTGPQKAALIGAISREIRPHWRAPEGLEAERLVTFVTFNLNRDGTISGTPTTRQEGITDANRAQASRHAEQAVRAVRLAAPFDLPDAYYDAWKRVIDFRFDRRLSQ